MKYCILIFALFIMLSCKEKNDCCIVFDATVKIQFKDASGRDLLDQSKSYAYKHSNMKHLYLKHFYQQNDIKKEVSAKAKTILSAEACGILRWAAR